MMYTMSITASTGTFLATYPSADDCIVAAHMVQSGAQVSQPVSVEITHDQRKATVRYNARSCKGLMGAVESLLGTLAAAPEHVPPAGQNRDVTVPVNFAVDSDVALGTAEAWVNNVMTDALRQFQEEYPEGGAYQFNGEPAGQARWDD